MTKRDKLFSAFKRDMQRAIAQVKAEGGNIFELQKVVELAETEWCPYPRQGELMARVINRHPNLLILRDIKTAYNISGGTLDS